MRLGITRKKHRIVFVPIVFVLIFVGALIKLEPAFISYLDADANNLVTEAINKSVEQAFNGYNCSKLYILSEGAFSVNTAEVNKLKSDITLRLQDMLKTSSVAHIPIGSAAGFYLLNGIGPKIPVKITPLALVNTDFQNSFTSEGINFVKHSLYLHISVRVNYSGFLLYKNDLITAKVPVLEYVTSGDVPEYYGGGVDFSAE